MHSMSDIMCFEGRIVAVILLAAGQPLRVTDVPFLKPTLMSGYPGGQAP
jgi:hypothetical protein